MDCGWRLKGILSASVSDDNIDSGKRIRLVVAFLNGEETVSARDGVAY